MPSCQTLAPAAPGFEALGKGGHVTACVDRPDQADRVVRQACALAKALAAPMTLFQVLETRPGLDVRPDPVEWDLRRHEARQRLGRLAALPAGSALAVDIRLAEGRAADEICRLSKGQPDGLVVLGIEDDDDSPGHPVSGTILHVLHRSASPVMLVPSLPVAQADCAYRHILVPIDGSTWAESVIPLAARLARASGAELILAHVVPSPELTETGPYEAVDLELRRRVVDRNATAARHYLDRLRAKLAGVGLNVRVQTAEGDDVRTALAAMIQADAPDLVIMSARGHGVGLNADMAFGSVAAYLMAHCPTPMLIVRGRSAPMTAPHPHEQALRLPALASA